MGGGPDHLLFLLPHTKPESAIERIQKKYPKLKITYVQVTSKSRSEMAADSIPPGKASFCMFVSMAWSDQYIAEVWKDVNVLVTLFTLPSKLSDAPLLEFIQLYSAGSNQIANHPIYTDTDIPIATASGVHGPQIAEWVVMTYLVHSHKYRQLYELQKERRWGKVSVDSDYSKVRDTVGLRLGVLGYGSIGRQVARVGKAMGEISRLYRFHGDTDDRSGMDVIAYTATPKDTPEKKKDNGFIVPGTGDPDGSLPSAWYSGLDKPSLHDFLSQDIDLLLVSVPLTNDTKHMLSEQEFSILSQHGKKPAFVTNIARGQIIDQDALIKSLKDGTLDGAALDVTDPEPLPEDSELWGLENAIVTPHVSGIGQAYTDRAMQILELQLEHREKGEKLINVIRRERGY